MVYLTNLTASATQPLLLLGSKLLWVSQFFKFNLHGGSVYKEHFFLRKLWNYHNDQLSSFLFSLRLGFETGLSNIDLLVRSAEKEDSDL